MYRTRRQSSITRFAHPTGGGDRYSISVPATAIKTLANAGFTITDVPGMDQTDFIINSNLKKKKNRELLNLKVKEAFAHAVDRAHIIRVVFLGKARPANSIVPSSTGAWHNPNLKPEKFDLGHRNQQGATRM